MLNNRIKKSIALALVGVSIATPILGQVSANEHNNEKGMSLVEMEEILSKMELDEETKFDENQMIEELNMTYKDLEELYKTFDSKNFKSNTEEVYDDTQDFVNYAVSIGAIEDTEEAKSRATVDTYRLQFKTAAGLLKTAGYFYAGDFLLNSVQLNPSTKSYAASSNLASDIKLQTSYKNAKNTIKTSLGKLSSSTTSYNTKTESLAFGYSGVNQKSWDLYLAINKADYSAKCTKSSGKWSYTMTISDIYNFEYWKFSDAPNITKQIVTIINNYAAGAQMAGAIRTFNVKVLVNDSI